MMTGTSGPIPSASYLKWDQNTQFWRTSQASMWEMENGQHMGASWLDSFPKSGICQNGLVYPQHRQAPHTSETGGGLWPTPVARDSGGHTITPNYPEGFNSNLVTEVEKERRRHIPTLALADVYTGNMESSQQSDDPMHSVSLPDFVGRFPTPSTMDHIDRKQMRPSRAATNRKTGYLSEMIGLFPTPVADGDRQTNYQQGGTALGVAARLWPTPNAHEDRAEKYTLETSERHLREGRQIHLAQVVRMFPTPRAGKTTDEDEESWLARHADGKVATPPLALAARMFPTPTSRDHKDGDAHSCQNVPVNGLLGREVHMLPTPSSGGDSGGPHGIRGGSWAKEKLVETFGEEDAVAMSGGSLSPDWVSWLMGLPVGWTSLEPLPREEYLDWFHAQQEGTWWEIERGLPRVATGIKNRVNRLKCLGNGIVPASLALFLRGTR
jgi:hypothetical protein